MTDKIWLQEPEDHDFPAAGDYLELLFSKERAAAIVEKLRKTKTVVKKAKDVLRASGLPLLDVGFQQEGTLGFQNLSPLTCPLA
ncbi:MAG: hypothetical protein PVS2B1_22780 [Candidatus Dormibacteraceae bacterium]